MKKNEFLASYGDTQKVVAISQPVGGGTFYQVFIDNYYQGDLEKRGDRWVAHLNRNSELTGDDIFIMGEMIDAGLD